MGRCSSSKIIAAVLFVMASTNVVIRLSKAGIGFGPCNQWFSYVDVTEGSRVFVWLIQCNNHNLYDYNTPIKNKPLMVHVGGPEMSASGFAFFYGTGPMTDKNRTRLLPVTDLVNVLYVDLPVGVGYSYTEKSDGYSTESSQIADDLVKVMIDVLNKQPHLKSSSVFFYAESVACKYTIEATYKLNKMSGQNSGLGLNLVGVVLGSPWINPFRMVSEWAQYAFVTGLVGRVGRDKMTHYVREKIAPFVKSGSDDDLLTATKNFKTLQRLSSRLTDGINECNIMVTACGSAFVRRAAVEPGDTPKYIMNLIHCGIWEKKLSPYMNENVKPRLGQVVPQHVIWNKDEKTVIRFITKDFMSSCHEKFVASLLNETKLFVVFINGQVDMVTNTVGVSNWLNNIEWNGKLGFNNAYHNSFTNSHHLCDGIIGYYRQFNQLYHFKLLYTGHTIAKENHKGLRSILEIVMNF